MKSHILQHLNERDEAFKPNVRLDALIDKIRKLVEPLQKEANRQFDNPKGPLIALVGSPRSGITFISQLLANTGAFSYPSNFLARFAYSPYLGALVQQMILNPEFDFRNELSDLQFTKGFSSDLGKTNGALGINEFFHFWRRFFPNYDPDYLDSQALSMVKVDVMRQELASIEAAFGKPFMCKAKMLQYNLSFFTEAMPELVIIHVRRDPLYVMQSIIQARTKYYGTDHIWWSVKPREYSFLKDQDPATQIAGQLLFTDIAIQRESLALPSNRYIEVRYEDVCKSPHSFLYDLADRLCMPSLIEHIDEIDRSFSSGNTLRLQEDVLKNLMSRYKVLEAQYVNGSFI